MASKKKSVNYAPMSLEKWKSVQKIMSEIKISIEGGMYCDGDVIIKRLPDTYEHGFLKKNYETIWLR